MPQAASTRRVFLIGFMGAGKTTVGRVLAQRLGWAFHDLDEVIERRQGRSVAEIFVEFGEASFRRMESAALRQLLQNASETAAGEIIALGGGAFVQPENREMLGRSGGMVVLLEAPLEELRRRCALAAGSRPLAGDPTQFAVLYAQRRNAYELAPFRVQTMDRTVEEVAAKIESMIQATKKAEVPG